MRKQTREFIFSLSLILISIGLTGCTANREETPTETAVADNLPAPPPTWTAVAPIEIAGQNPTAIPPTPIPSTESVTAYPGPSVSSPSSTPNAYPAAAEASATAENTNNPPGGSSDIYLPITGGSPPTTTPTATPVPPPSPTPLPTATPTPIPTVDFAAKRAELQAAGQDLGFVKMGFHVTLHEDRDVLDNWMQSLDAAGVPLFIKTVDNAEPLFRAQELAKASGVPHTLVYRSSGGVPAYELPPEQAAQIHWEFHRNLFPPELDPSMVWIETLNEVDRTRAEWFGKFALETARLAMAEGYRWAAFGWASGEPEPEQWQTPSMLEFLRLAAENPDQLAIALHEYSYISDDIAHEYPFKVGRFQELLRIADANGIPRPTILITEWGWEYANIPPIEKAMRDIAWAARLYGSYPEVKGAAIWNLGIGCCYEDISEQVTKLVEPITYYALRNYVPRPPAPVPVEPEKYR